MPRDNEDPVEEREEASPSKAVSPPDRRQDALNLLIQARENLIAQMAEEIMSNRDAILGDPSQTGIFGFEFQEIEDRYIGRLNAINSILDNLEYRPARIVNKTEVLLTTKKRLKKDLDDLIARYDQWDLVSVNATKVGEDQLMLILALTADEYPEDEAEPRAPGGGGAGGDAAGGEGPD
jgi:hypothetical protein